MTPAKDYITVKVDIEQNDSGYIGGNYIQTGRRYNENFRERNPVVAQIITGNEELKAGMWIVCNYNYFNPDSPLHLFDDVYVIHIDQEIFAAITDEGSLTPLCGNILVERVTKETPIELPDDLKKPHNNQGIVSVGAGRWKQGQYILWLPFADYEIVYHWNGRERRALKVHSSEIVGYLKK